MTKRFLLGVGVLATIVLLVALLLPAPAAAQSEGRISGIVYSDANGNGIREEGEDGLKDVRIQFSSGGWSTSVLTADDGSFSIDLNPATWTVQITEIAPDGYGDPPDDTVEVVIENAGDTVNNLDFGLVPEGTVLPEAGGAIPGPAIIGGLVVLLLLGVGFVFMGQRRSAQPA